MTETSVRTPSAPGTTTEVVPVDALPGWSVGQLNRVDKLFVPVNVDISIQEQAGNLGDEVRIIAERTINVVDEPPLGGHPGPRRAARGHLPDGVDGPTGLGTLHPGEAALSHDFGSGMRSYSCST